VGDEEIAEVVEHRLEPGGAELTQRVAEVHAALPLAGESKAVPEAQAESTASGFTPSCRA
jgi:hypothetical protein